MDFYSNAVGEEVIQRGKKKIYSAKERLELTLPNGDSDGFLEKGDLVYLSQKYKVNGTSAYRFRVMKFFDTEKQSKVYTAEKIHFEPHFEKKSSADAVEKTLDAVANKVADEKEFNYTVPAILGIGAGVLGYMGAQKYGKNTIHFALGGLVIGVAVGIFLVKRNEKKQAEK